MLSYMQCKESHQDFYNSPPSPQQEACLCVVAHHAHLFCKKVLLCTCGDFLRRRNGSRWFCKVWVTTKSKPDISTLITSSCYFNGGLLEFIHGFLLKCQTSCIACNCMLTVAVTWSVHSHAVAKCAMVNTHPCMNLKACHDPS